MNTKETLLYDEDHLTISYDPLNRWLYNDWKGLQSDVNIKEGGAKILEFLKLNNCTKVLNDNRNVKGAWPGAVEWAANVWTPQMIEAGLEYFAWIYPADVISQMSANRMVKKADDQGQEKFRFFSDINEAKSWLTSQ